MLSSGKRTDISVSGKRLRASIKASKRKFVDVAEDLGITYVRLWQIFQEREVDQHIIDRAVVAGIIIEGVNDQMVPTTKLLSLLAQTQQELQRERERNKELEQIIINLRKNKP